MTVATQAGGVAHVDELLVTAEGAARLLSLSRRTVDRMTRASQMPAPRKLRGRVLYDVEELRAWVRFGCPSRVRFDELIAAERRRRRG